MLEILNAPNPVLSDKASPVKKIDKSILDLIAQMTESMEKATDPVGVGLAAPQIGKSLQIFIAKPTAKSKVLTFINPKIIDSSPIVDLNKKKHTRKLEGCLSLKDIWGEVERHPSVTLEYLDEKGNKHTRKFVGFIGTIVQHEIDHLEGVLFPKKVLEQKGILYQSKKDEKGEDYFEELKI